MIKLRIQLLHGLPALALLPILLAASSASMSAQVPPERARTGELFQTIQSLDSALFASATYERCDIEAFKAFFSDDIEFYHDQSGVSEGIETLAQQVEQNLCGKVRRELVEGTLEVYPMHGYGAVEIGVHRFYQPKNGPGPTGEAKFMHLWQNKDGAWKITRVISYDHVGLQK